MTRTTCKKTQTAHCCDDAHHHEHVDSCTTPSVIVHTYRVYGMDCSSCAKSVEKGVAQLPEIEGAHISFSTGKLKVQALNEQAFSPVEETVEQLGYKIESLSPKKTVLQTYKINGMDCTSCAKSIENHLNTLSAVSEATIHFASGKLKIEHCLNEADLFLEIEKLGYKASLLNQPVTHEKTKKWASDSIGLLISSIFIAIGFGLTFTKSPEIISTLLYVTVIAICGYKPLRSAFYAVKSKSLDMNVLMSVAAIGAMLIGEWSEGATVVWLFAIGSYLQSRSIEKTRQSISGLMNLAPPEAWVEENGQLIKKDVSSIQINDIIVIKPGDKVPLDGVVLFGESSINQAPITGESIPVDKHAGDTVYAGTMNEHGTLHVEVTKLVADTTIAKIIHLIEEAQEKKAPTEAFVDKFASIYTPIVFVAALVIMIIPPILGFSDKAEWFYKGLELLVVACPCALVISTPVAIVSAIGNAARNGVLIKGGTFLEAAGKIDAIAFDKTGTLTEGKPAVSKVIVYEGSDRQFYEIAYTLEQYSTHPIASAITKHVESLGYVKLNAASYQNIVGKGVQAIIDEQVFYAGNVKLFEELNAPLTNTLKTVEQLQQTGHTVIIIGTATTIYGVIAVADQIRANTITAIQHLKRSGIKETVMLTGDNARAAAQIALSAQVDRYFANLLPEQKVDAIQQLQNEGRSVAMVGDGINDAPALATANIGIAMGGAGTDTAMETADIVLIADNLEKLPHTMQLSRKALTIIKQNIIFSLIIKAIALAMIFPGWLTLWMAVLSDTGAALIVILNSLRLVKFKS